MNAWNDLIMDDNKDKEHDVKEEEAQQQKKRRKGEKEG